MSKSLNRLSRWGKKYLSGEVSSQIHSLTEFSKQLEIDAALMNIPFNQTLNEIAKRMASFCRFPFRPLPTRTAYYRHLAKMYDMLVACSATNDNEKVRFGDAVFPTVQGTEEKGIFLLEAICVVVPYMLQQPSLLNLLFDGFSQTQGPYELNEVQIPCGQTPNERPIVLDCGASLGVFSAIASAKGCSVYAFEPILETIEHYLNKTATWNKNIEIVQGALWHENTTLEFEATTDSRISSQALGVAKVKSQNPIISVPAISLDEFVKEKKLDRVDFIKADIEGAERNMLMGAKEVLQKFQPMLSLCTYHLPDDSEVMKKLILEANPNYHIFERRQMLYAFVP